MGVSIWLMSVVTCDGARAAHGDNSGVGIEHQHGIIHDVNETCANYEELLESIESVVLRENLV